MREELRVEEAARPHALQLDPLGPARDPAESGVVALEPLPIAVVRVRPRPDLGAVAAVLAVGVPEVNRATAAGALVPDCSCVFFVATAALRDLWEALPHGRRLRAGRRGAQKAAAT